MCRYYRLFWLDSLRATRHADAPLAQNRQVTRVRRHRASPLLSSSLPPGPKLRRGRRRCVHTRYTSVANAESGWRSSSGAARAARRRRRPVRDALEVRQQVAPRGLHPLGVLELQRHEANEHRLEVGELLALKTSHLAVDARGDLLVLLLRNRVERLGLPHFARRQRRRLLLRGSPFELVELLTLGGERACGAVEGGERGRARSDGPFRCADHLDVVAQRLLEGGPLARALLVVQVGHAVDGHAHRGEGARQRRVDVRLAVCKLRQGEPEPRHRAGERAVALDEALRVSVHRRHLCLHRVGVVRHLRARHVLLWPEGRQRLRREHGRRARVRREEAGLDVCEDRAVVRRRFCRLLRRLLPRLERVVGRLEESLQVRDRVQLRVGGDPLEEALQLRAPNLDPLGGAADAGDAHGRHLRGVLLRQGRHDRARVLGDQLAVEPVKVAEAARDGELAVGVLRQRRLCHDLVGEEGGHAVPLLGGVRDDDVQVGR
mmetsp:Transcript_33619/g.100051  ORF Transcript_33619/g.100051 Transcript_33619/m.100051 type:complete len:490 (+) Transcript_33619:17-1486(+)